MPDMQNDKLIFESGIKDQIGIASQRRKMALRVEKAFGPKMEHLMRMQLNYDLALARAAADRIWVNVV